MVLPASAAGRNSFNIPTTQRHERGVPSHPQLSILVLIEHMTRGDKKSPIFDQNRRASADVFKEVPEGSVNGQNRPTKSHHDQIGAHIRALSYGVVNRYHHAQDPPPKLRRRTSWPDSTSKR